MCLHALRFGSCTHAGRLARDMRSADDSRSSPRAVRNVPRRPDAVGERMACRAQGLDKGSSPNHEGTSSPSNNPQHQLRPLRNPEKTAGAVALA